ncbi:MAG: M28 family peptidase [Bacteroidota bacterium]
MKYLTSKALIVFSLMLYSSVVFSQKNVSNEQIQTTLKKHITFLADDKLEGRLVGSAGEKTAYEYIIKNLQQSKVESVNGNSFLQEFKTKHKLNPHASSKDSGSIEITGHNVIGYINNNAANYIVIGAHFDHLGYNEYGGSTYKGENGESPKIHNGADDNASGTAALLVLADLLSKGEFKKNNYLFIAFSGEEEGLLGSNYFCKHPTIDLTKVTYMINMDMVGRMDTVKRTLAVSGYGTSPTWGKAFSSLTTDEFKFKFDSSGTGPSDHTSFYNVGIPVLHFFTGTHSDYHKPSDDEQKINYNDEGKVVRYIYTLIGKLDAEPKLAFTKTREDSSSKVSFKVTLGIMPDYMFEGKGVSVDGVTDGKPAAKAGIKRGDVIIQLGEIKTDDMQLYMKALSKFSKGETTKVKIIRDKKEFEFELTF